MTTYTQPDSIVVSKKSFDSDEPYAIIGSNISFINALFGEYVRAQEISIYALQSYYVDYYLAQMNNGGFSQFVYNSRWNQDTIDFIVEGLKSMGARQHLVLFKKASALLEKVDPEKLEQFFEDEYFGENEERDFLNQYSDEFYALDQEENLVALNAAWLRQHSQLVVLPVDEMYVEVERQASSIPDRTERIANALANEPRYKKIIRKLCVEYEHSFDCVTSGLPSYQYKGETLVAWFFKTDVGLYYMVETGSYAYMHEAKSNVLIGEIPALLD